MKALLKKKGSREWRDLRKEIIRILGKSKVPLL